MMVDTYQNLVFSVCYKVTRDYFAAEDLAQETFLSAYKNLDGFEGGNEKAWLCRIATNKSIDYLRGAGRRAVPYRRYFFRAAKRRQGHSGRNLPGKGGKGKAVILLRQVKTDLL